MALVRLSEHKERAGAELDERGVPRNGREQPLIKCMVPAPIKKDPDRKKEKLVAYTRMTTWIDVLEDKTNITKWYRRLALVGLSRVDPSELPALLVSIREADEQGDKRKLMAIAERMHKLAGGEDKANKGSWLHKLSEYADQGLVLPGASEADLLDMAAYTLATVDLEVKEIEQFCVLDEFKVGGTPDRMSFYAGPDPDGVTPAGHLITDLKTGTTQYGGLKMSAQVSGYAHGRPYYPDNPFESSRSHWPDDLNKRWGLIINAPAGTGTCEVLWVDLTIGWKAFLVAQKVREIRREGRRVFRQFVEPSQVASLGGSAEEEGDDDAS